MLPGNSDEARFGHLLQPIRDLTKNWQVDIATQLEDYLNEIGTVRISFDGGQTSMNFAEAALLIQGSACVYSKKVEFLYSMVYQTLDALASKKKSHRSSSVDAEGQDADATFSNSKEEFLSLDDIPQAKNVNMRGEANESFEKSVQVTTRAPLSLRKLDDLDRGIPLINRKGETVAFRMDFKLNSDSYHETGTMMRDPIHFSLLEQSLMRHPASTPVLDPAADAMEEDLIPALPEDDDDDNQPPLNASLDDVDMGDIFDDFNNSIGDVKEEVGRGGLRPQRMKPLNVVEFKKDPWETYDPDQPAEEKDRPYKKIRPFKLPPSLAKAKGRKRKRTVEKKEPLQPLTEFISKAYFSHAAKLPTNPIKVPSHPEFEDAFWVVYKKHEANMRKEKALLMKQGKREEEVDEYLREDPPPEDIYPGAGEDDDDNAPLDGFDDIDPDDIGVGGGMDVQPDPFSQYSAQELVMDYENLVKGYVEAYMANAEKYAQTTDLAKRVQQWEDKIAPLLKQEEEQGFFDIHDYGTKVLERLEVCTKAGQERVLFSQLLSDCVNYDISRMFLASLQLANNYNVEISSPDKPGEERVDTMKLKLLSKTRHHEEMAEYKAPSVQ